MSRRQGIQGEIDEDDLIPLSRHRDSPEGQQTFTLLYSQRLQLSSQAAFLASHIAEKSFNAGALHVPISVTAAPVYIASHIFHQPRSLSEVAGLMGISETTLHYAYRVLHSYRYEYINDVWLILVGGTTLGEAAEALPSLMWPPLDREVVDSDEQRMQEDSHGVATMLSINRQARQLCFFTRITLTMSLMPNAVYGFIWLRILR